MLLASVPLPAQEAPVPAGTGRYLVGAQMCPIWNGDGRWKAIRPFPDRMPLLGWYHEGDPAVTDWEVKWALDHGISFFMVCWYRAKENLGHSPVHALCEHWLQSLPNSRFGAQLKFAIQWENANDIACGVASAADLLENVLPYWIENFFRRPNYLMDEGRPVLAIYDMRKFSDQLGGEAGAAAVMGKMRAACRRAGFAGLTVLGQQCWGAPEAPVEKIKRAGADGTYPYHLPSFEGFPEGPNPPAAAIIAAQERAWRRTLVLPRIVSVSMGWDSAPWGRMFGRMQWRLTPAEFRELCVRAKATLDARTGGGIAERMVLIDAWNEFGEGHYVFPTQEHRFGYLDAIREVFSPGAKPHTDSVP